MNAGIVEECIAGSNGLVGTVRTAGKVYVKVVHNIEAKVAYNSCKH